MADQPPRAHCVARLHCFVICDDPTAAAVGCAPGHPSQYPFPLPYLPLPPPPPASPTNCLGVCDQAGRYVFVLLHACRRTSNMGHRAAALAGWERRLLHACEARCCGLASNCRQMPPARLGVGSRQPPKEYASHVGKYAGTAAALCTHRYAPAHHTVNSPPPPYTSAFHPACVHAESAPGPVLAPRAANLLHPADTAAGRLPVERRRRGGRCLGRQEGT